jgi:hypothetical protein
MWYFEERIYQVNNEKDLGLSGLRQDRRQQILVLQFFSLKADPEAAEGNLKNLVSYCKGLAEIVGHFA